MNKIRKVQFKYAHVLISFIKTNIRKCLPTNVKLSEKTPLTELKQ